jgi:hypothetical protein
MPPPPQSQVDETPGPQRPDEFRALIAEQVVRALGTPAGLLRVQVRRLWDRSYRVNVVLGPDALSTRIADSFFVTVDGSGTIVGTSPPLTRRYVTPPAQ